MKSIKELKPTEKEKELFEKHQEMVSKTADIKATLEKEKLHHTFNYFKNYISKLGYELGEIKDNSLWPYSPNILIEYKKTGEHLTWDNKWINKNAVYKRVLITISEKEIFFEIAHKITNDIVVDTRITQNRSNDEFFAQLTQVLHWFHSNENLNEEECTKEDLSKLHSYLLKNSKSLDPDIVEIVNRNFWKLLA